MTAASACSSISRSRIDPGIAVAAPIAYIGYIQMPIPQLQFFTDPTLPEGYYRVDLTLTAFNGQREVVEMESCLLLRQ